MTVSEARELATRVAGAAIGGGPADWLSGSEILERLDGRSWLLLDKTARRFTYAAGTPVSGVRGWLGPSLGEPSGFVAAVTSLHVDGRFRERAVQVLTTVGSRVATAALSVRLLDHVSAVRAQAWQGLRPRLSVDTADVVLDVLLSGHNRQRDERALADVQAAVLRRTAEHELVSRLAGSDRRAVRRWAFTFGRERDLFSPDDLVTAARGDPDQWLRARCAEWLMDVPDVHLVTALLDAKSVEARLVALTRVPDGALSDDTLGALLTDRAQRVREQARWRAHQRGFDVAGFYRRELADAGAPRVLAACLDGLAVVGNETDLPACLEYLDHMSVRVRASAVNAVLGWARREEVVRLLAPVLLDSSARVSTAASRGLAKMNAPQSTANAAWASTQPGSRRAAWRLSREAGGWHRVEADLRAAGDPDPHLSSLGLDGIRNWLDVSAATTWNPLPEEQRARLAALLPASGLDEDRKRMVAFHAGIKLSPTDGSARAGDDAEEPVAAKKRSWLRLVRRR
jgi:HEAT repeat protein